MEKEKKLRKVVLIDFNKKDYFRVEISESTLKALDYIREYTYLFNDMAICDVDECTEYTEE